MLAALAFLSSPGCLAGVRGTIDGRTPLRTTGKQPRHQRFCRQIVDVPFQIPLCIYEEFLQGLQHEKVRILTMPALLPYVRPQLEPCG
jgi:hypothetical protein